MESDKKGKIDWSEASSSFKEFLESEKIALNISNPLMLGASLNMFFRVPKLIEDLKNKGRLSVEAKDDVDELLNQSDSVKSKSGNVIWKLKDSTRSKLLKQLAESGEDVEGLLPKSGSNLEQAMFNNYVKGKAPNVMNQSYDQLSATSKVYDWLKLLSVKVPSRSEIESELRMKELILSFRRITENFQGRAKELSQLKEYVEWLSADGIIESLTRKVRRVSGGHHDPLLIHGLGGIGKTTLVARFILDHISHKNYGNNLPFVYLDFDKAGLIPQEPLTILFEAVRQLAIQFPESGDGLDDLRSNIYEDLKRSFRNKSRRTNRSVRSSSDEQTQFIRKFSEIWQNVIGNQDTPILLVLDSFEEVQSKHSQSDIVRLIGFVDNWRDIVPNLRVVLVGRSKVSDLDTENLEIGDFDEEAATGYLLSTGLDDSELASKIASAVGGNPLSLSLAASIIEKTKKDKRLTGLDGIRQHSYYIFRVKQEEIQEQLFKRNLEHINDREVKKIAMPGLVVRYINKDVIKNILREPCDLGDVSDEQIHNMLKKIRQEAFLISANGSDRIRFRPELRRSLLPMIHSDSPSQSVEIHRNAISFYEQFDDIKSKSEAFYHRLMMGEERNDLERLYDAHMREFLQHSMHELPPNSQIFLSDKFGINPPDEVYQIADANNRIVKLKKELEESLSSGDQQALRHVLDYSKRLRKDIDHVQIDYYEVMAQTRLGNAKKSLEQAKMALQKASNQLDFRLVIKLQFLMAIIHEINEDYGKALEFTQRAIRTANSKENLFSLIKLVLQFARLNRRLRKNPEEQLSDYWKRINEYVRLKKKWTPEEKKKLALLVPGTDKKKKGNPSNLVQKLSEVTNDSRWLSAYRFRRFKKQLKKEMKNSEKLELFVKEVWSLRLSELINRGVLDYDIHEFLLLVERENQTGVMYNRLLDYHSA